MQRLETNGNSKCPSTLSVVGDFSQALPFSAMSDGSRCHSNWSIPKIFPRLLSLIYHLIFPFNAKSVKSSQSTRTSYTKMQWNDSLDNMYTCNTFPSRVKLNVNLKPQLLNKATFSSSQILHLSYTVMKHEYTVVFKARSSYRKKIWYSFRSHY